MTDKTVPVFIEDEAGERVQVGWATPDNGGVRKISLLDEHKNTSVKDVKFGDVEPVEVAPDPELAAEPVDAGVDVESDEVIEAELEDDEANTEDEDESDETEDLFDDSDSDEDSDQS